jgi:hypothetical protein
MSAIFEECDAHEARLRVFADDDGLELVISSKNNGCWQPSPEQALRLGEALVRWAKQAVAAQRQLQHQAWLAATRPCLACAGTSRCAICGGLPVGQDGHGNPVYGCSRCKYGSCSVCAGKGRVDREGGAT